MAVILFLLLLGLVLVFLEFFLPGMVLAILGSLALLASALLMFTHYAPLWGILYSTLLCAVLLFLCRFALFSVKRSKGKGNFYHGEDQEGYLASEYDVQLIGKQGSVATELKPSGHIFVENRLYQALSETGLMSKGTPVDIVGGRGSYLIVRERK